MIIKSNKIFFGCVLAAVLLFSSAALAQKTTVDSSQARPAQTAEEQARASLHDRIIKVVNLMTARVNAEGADFNKHLAQMNAAAPLETSHLDSAGLAASVPLVLEFLQYIKDCRHSSDSLNQAFNDSMFALNADLPAGEVDENLKEIDNSFNEDRAAFSNFLAALDKAYAKVLDALLFLQNAQYTIVKDQLSFNSKKSYTEYSKLMKSVDAANVELGKSNEALRKANAKANKKVKKQISNSSE